MNVYLLIWEDIFITDKHVNYIRETPYVIFYWMTLFINVSNNELNHTQKVSVKSLIIKLLFIKLTINKFVSIKMDFLPPPPT